MATLLDYALCSVSDVKELLGIASSDNTKNNLIIRKINQATEIIEGYCRRRFKETTYTDEIYDGTGTDQLGLLNYPISAVTLSMRDTTLNEADFNSVDSELFFIDSTSGLLNGVGSFYGGWGQYRVTYTAGYSTIPSDLAEACATLAAYFVSNDPSMSAFVTRKKEGSREISYSDTANRGNLYEQLGIQITLDRYSRTTLGG